MSGSPILAFTHIPKTAGMTMTTILRSVYGLRHCRAVRTGPTSPRAYRQRDLELALRLYPGLQAISGHPLRPFADFGEHASRLRWATLLRDPVERFYSAYRYFCVTRDVEMSFPDWCAAHGKSNTQVRWIAGEPDVGKAKDLLDERFVWVGDQADLNTSLAVLAAVLDDPRFPTSTGQVVNPTPSMGTGYDRELAVRCNALDIELYEHFQREIWPRQLADHDLPADRPFTAGGASRLRLTLNRAFHGLVYKRVQKLACGRSTRRENHLDA